MTITASIIVAVASALIAGGSLVVAFTSMKKNDYKLDKDQTKENIEIHTGLQSQIDILTNTLTPRIEAIDNGIRDLKAERRIDNQNINKRFDDLRDEIHEIGRDAKLGVKLAESAHRRLDALGAPADSISD